MSIAMGTRLHINLYIYKTTSVPILVLLSQNAQSYPLAALLQEIWPATEYMWNGLLESFDKSILFSAAQCRLNCCFVKKAKM